MFPAISLASSREIVDGVTPSRLANSDAGIPSAVRIVRIQPPRGLANAAEALWSCSYRESREIRAWMDCSMLLDLGMFFQTLHFKTYFFA